jgi:hypothetical protein
MPDGKMVIPTENDGRISAILYIASGKGNCNNG